MEVLGQVLGAAQVIYALCDQASSNKQQCRRLEKRVKMLLLAAQSVAKYPEKSQELQEVAEELAITLENAKGWVQKYSHSSWLRKVIQANGIREEFDLINDRLSDAAESLTFMLSAEQGKRFHQFFTANTLKKQNQKDMEEDLSELRKFLSAHANNMENKMDHMTGEMRDLNTKLEEINLVCQRPRWDITNIRGNDLKRGELLLERETHCLYRGEYHRSPVAIKVFKWRSWHHEESIRRTFEDERETMRKFECLNILRLYGIYIDNSGPETSYSLVMEFCSKGTLRELLQREPDLSCERRIRMALDAARALYRLHQTEVKPMLHGSLSSSKFLVDETYCVKLFGFELSKTESSIRKPVNAENVKKYGELEYMAPESWRDINAYSKRSEIYSLGVVMFEIASGNRPFQGLEVTEENLAQMQEQWWDNLEAELPPSCPQIFRDLIKRLVQKNPGDRPSAGVIVDRLMVYLNQQETEGSPAENLKT